MLKQVQHDIFAIFPITTQPPGGEDRPFIPPAELGGILAHFDKIRRDLNKTIDQIPLMRYNNRK
jgi:hypothetical protein